jgi:hypothetical protein
MQRSGMRGEMAMKNGGEPQSPSLTGSAEAGNLPCRCQAATGEERVPKPSHCPLQSPSSAYATHLLDKLGMAGRLHLTGIHFGFAAIHFHMIRPKRRTVQTVE